MEIKHRNDLWQRVGSVAVVIPAHNAARTLLRCLDALSREGVPGPLSPLIVVDDGSTDDTAVIALRAGATIITTEARGPAAARNAGAQATSADVLVFLDADTAPCPGWLEALLQPLQDGSIAAVKGCYRTEQTSLLARFAQAEFEQKYERLARAPHLDFVDAGTAAIRRAAFECVGGFDESFPAQSAEDVDLGYRLAAAGHRLAFAPDAVVLHQHAESLAAYLRKKVRYGYFRTRVYRRFPAKLLGDAYTPPVMAIQVLLAWVALASTTLVAAGRPNARRVLGVSGAAMLLTSLPLARRAWGVSPRVGLVAPVLVTLRSLALGAGLAAGLVGALIRGR